VLYKKCDKRAEHKKRQELLYHERYSIKSRKGNVFFNKMLLYSPGLKKNGELSDQFSIL
jgi:hypothetical protein